MTCVDARPAPIRGRLARGHGLALAGALLIASVSAHAALGGDAASIAQDRGRLGASLLVASSGRPQAQAQAQAPTSAPVQAHRLTLADGSTVTEFITPGGRVFAVSWSTRLKPRLDALLGAQSAVYAAAAQRSMRVPGPRHALSIDEGDLVVHATSRLNAHVGIAYLRSLVPAGRSINDFR
jgi:hypothetical protein